MTLRTRLEKLENAVPRGTDLDKPEWWALGADLSPIVLQIVADLGLDLDECAAWVRIAGDGLVEMTSNMGVILADADACDVASKLSARIAGP